MRRAKKCRQMKKKRDEERREDISDKSDDDVVTPLKVYASRQAAGKALKHLRVKLPFSPRKRKAVTLQLALEEETHL